MTVIEQMGARAKTAARVLANAGTEKNKSLMSIAKALRENCQTILKANEIDI